MLLTPDEAAAIARKRGLTLSDAVAILRLAQTTEEAEAFADTFADPKPPQLTRDDLKGMSPEAINKAREAGQCNELLTGGSE